jgi:thiamine-phosphate pyrophosphorylase
MMAEALPPCRLYLVLPPVPATIDEVLSQALAATEIACVLRWGGKTNIDEAWDAQLCALAQRHEAAFLVEADADRAKRIGADGVHILADVPLYRRTRDRLGQRAIVGVGCGLSRHDAMTLGELGADYVAFGPDAAHGAGEIEERAELIAWWSETFEVPCVAWNVETPAEAERLARLGADFIALDPSIFAAAEPARRIAEVGATLQGVRSAA